MTQPQSRSIGATTSYYIGSTSYSHSGPNPHGNTTGELDTHADTTALGRHALMLSDTNQRVTVHPFAPGLKTMKDIPIVSAALAYDCPTTMATYVLIFHQALFIPTMDNNLICPAQLRSNQLTVNDTPLIHIPSEQRCAEDHSILGPDDLH